MIYGLIAAYGLAAVLMSGNAQRLAALVAVMLSLHFGIDAQLANEGYLMRFSIAATFNALTIGAIVRWCELDDGVMMTVKILATILMLNIATGLSDTFGLDIFDLYYQAAIALYSLLIVSIGVSDGRANSLFELGGVFNRLRARLFAEV
jgi:hypothetical protein